MTFRTGRRALTRATAWLVVALGLAFQAGCAGSTASTGRSTGKATVIVGHALRMPGYDGYRRDAAIRESRSAIRLSRRSTASRSRCGATTPSPARS